MVFPNVPRPDTTNLANYYIIQVCVGAWAQAEVIRFIFYSFKDLQQGIVGHCRYNFFLLMYPVGVGAELLCMWAAKEAIGSIEPASARPLTVLMPNAWNFQFRFEWSVYMCYTAYLFGFPQLYSYMLAQRKRFYSKISCDKKSN